jgi:AcrR family transcriptional regulator
MPKLWTDTIEAHRSSVADAIMDRTAELAAAEGLHALTMARIAEETGIGRATLYKYFHDIEEILVAWHRREVTAHLEVLSKIRDDAAGPMAALEAALLFYAGNARRSHDHALGAMLHATPHMRHAHDHLRRVISGLIADAIAAKELCTDASADELARFALAAVTAGATTGSKPAVRRLVKMILRGIGA